MFAGGTAFGSRSRESRTLFGKLAAKYYNAFMKITAKLKGELMREMGSLGGKARAKKYDKATLSKWGRKGGRPRKKAR
jgi:hypothetical protein